MSEQAHIPHDLTLFENAAHKNCQYHALVMANRTKKIFKYRIPNSFFWDVVDPMNQPLC